MDLAYGDLCYFIQQLTPTWRKTQHRNLTLLVQALMARPSLCLSNLARAYPEPHQPLHGRLKRLTRFLDNPRLDELALSVRWLTLAYRLGVQLPSVDPAAQLLVPILLDTTYFEPYAALIAAVPCGSRALPLALTTYHRRTLEACFPPREHWPETPCPARGGRFQPHQPAASQVQSFLSQNRIEEHLIDLVWHLLSPALQGVLVADRGFARASLLQRLRQQERDFVIRIDADTHVRLDPAQPSCRVDQALALRRGEQRWHLGATYHQEQQVPVNLLAVWDHDQEEPWYLATSLERAAWTEQLYRWRMRLECANRDEKTGVLLREGGDDHALTNLLHLHRLLVGLCVAEWLCALVGLQAYRDLPSPQESPSPLESAPPHSSLPVLDQGPSQPPPVLPHRGPTPKLPPWMRRFAVRGHLSYVRLGWEVLQASDLRYILRRLAHWLGLYLWPWTPLWRPWQVRYRLTAWWANSG
jgi:hypothetical protein